jgi:hypothetical protein
MKHYSIAELERYYARDLAALKQIFIRRHIESCKECGKRLKCIEENDILLKNIRNAVAEELPETGEAVYRNIESTLNSKVD